MNISRNKKIVIGVISALLVLAAFLLAYRMMTAPRKVTVIIDRTPSVYTTTYKTTDRTVSDFLKNQGIDYSEEEDFMCLTGTAKKLFSNDDDEKEAEAQSLLSGHDKKLPDEQSLSSMLSEKIADGMVIHITKAVHVTVVADGNTYEYSALPRIIVKDVLHHFDLTLDDDDLMDHLYGDVLIEGEQVVIQRVEVTQVTETEVTDYTSSTQYSSNYVIGSEQVSTEGKEGIIDYTYEIVTIDGEQVSKTLINTEVVQELTNEVISFGTKITTGTPADLTYVKKYTGCRVVSYYAGEVAYGSYGGRCTYGTCAVDSSVIPLGSLLYIEGYGYAVANDTGSAVKGTTIDVYMESLKQCGIWGAQTCTVYVVRKGP